MNLWIVGLIEVLLKFLFGIRRNVRHLPEGPCIIVSNHNSALDTYVLATLLTREHRRRTCVAAARDTFAAGLLGAFARWSLDVVLVDRRPKAHEDPLDPLKERLAQGRSLILYPEGTRGEPGRIEPFKRGVGLLGTAFPDLPIHPVFLKGVENCLGRNEFLLVPFEISLRVGERPLYGRDALAQAGNVRDASLLLTRQLEEEVRRLAGP